MSKLKSFKIVEAQSAAPANPVDRARVQLVHNLNRQLASAQAMVKGEAYFETRHEFVEDENGQRTRQAVQKPLRKWYWRDNDGQVRIRLRVRNRALELEKGKTDILVGEDDKLPQAIEGLIEAISTGDVDDLIKAHLAAKR